MVFALLGLVLLASSGVVISAQGTTQGYVSYRITSTSPMMAMNHSVVVNETVQPSSQSGLSIISFALTGTYTNFSISKIVNTTNIPETFPIIPPLSNESFNYSKNGYSISGSISNNGSSTFNFNGASYTGTNYSFFVTITNSTLVSTLDGTLLAAPSGLLYSANISGTGSQSATVQLIATNLPLSYSASTSSATGVAAVGVGIAGAAALAVPFWKLGRKKSEKQKPAEEKPSYWVD